MRDGYSRTAWRMFDAVFRPWMDRRLDDVLITGLPEDPDPERTILVCANHVSWWDGFLVREIHRRLRPEAVLSVVMLERELARRPYLGRLGAMGFRPESPGSFRGLLRRLESLSRQRPAPLVAFFPQGRIFPSHRRPLGFQAGVRLVWEALEPTFVLPLGIHIEPGNTVSPTAFVSAGEPVDPRAEGLGVEGLESRVQDELDRLLDFVSHHGEDAPAAWPGHTATLAGAYRSHPRWIDHTNMSGTGEGAP